MIHVVKIKVPAVKEEFRYRMEDAIIEMMAGIGSNPEYYEDEKEAFVRFLVTGNGLEWVNRWFKNVEVDHVSSFAVRWYNYHSNTYVQDNYQLEADGSASVRRRNNDETDEEPVELSSVSEEEFHKIFEEYFLGIKHPVKLIQWD